jgi:hypothetical protein
MGYPWYSKDRIAANVQNAQAAFTIEENCETKAIRYRFDLVCNNLRTRNKMLRFYASTKADAEKALENLIIKRANILAEKDISVVHAKMLISQMH